MIILIAMLFVILTCIISFVVLLVLYKDKADKLKVHCKVTLPFGAGVDWAAEAERGQPKQPSAPEKPQKSKKPERPERAARFKAHRKSK